MRSKPIAYVVVVVLGVFVVTALVMTWDLLKSGRPTEEANLLSNLCSAALGFLGGMLASTERYAAPEPKEEDPK